MRKYKTIVTDYEGLQGQLDAHAAQGWRLVSVTPETWRKSASPSDQSVEPAPFDELNTTSSIWHGYSASYYLVILEREEPGETEDRLAALEKEFPLGQSLLED